MCTRYSLENPNVEWESFGVRPPERFAPSHSITPGHLVWMIRKDEQGQPELTRCKWGLVPNWMNDFSRAQANARIETAANRPMFKEAFLSRRCLILADSFYLWQLAHGDKKKPWRIYPGHRRLMLFAGLWERYLVDSTLFFDSCAILTMPSSEQLQPITDRMPAIVVKDQAGSWLSGKLPDLANWHHLMNSSHFYCQPS